MNLKVSAAVVISTFILFGCGGGGGGGGSSYIGPSVTGTTYSGNTQTKTYSDGTTVTNTASSSSVSWASDHVTRTTVYSYADGGSNSVVDTVNPTVSTPTLTAAIYPSNWTTTGTVTAPTVSAKNNVYGDGYISAIEDGSSSKPFAQSTLSALSITDPSKYVTSSTTTYNLTWGTPDKDGPAFANLFPNASNTLSSALSYAGITVGGQTTTGPTLLKPSDDVIAAWNKGWTGKGANVLVIDSYASRGGCTYANGNCHGVVTMMNTDLIAPGASKFGLDYAFTSNFTGTAFDIAGTNLTSSKSINVINMSWMFTNPGGSWNCNNGCGTAPSTLTYNQGITNTATTHNNLINVLNSVTSVTNLSNFSNAVITASAGNDNLDTKYNLTALALSGNTNVASRLLVVGALDKNGTVASPATRASYSNYAGGNTAISDRFVMANGTMPWASGSVKINGSNFGGDYSGTSFAAPLVAGYAAIVMQKFPNLDAAKTSNIILDTARTDTLSCHPTCSSAIYGKGEASLSRALAPVGSLR
jgi:hypothetical protein